MSFIILKDIAMMSGKKISAEWQKDYADRQLGTIGMDSFEDVKIAKLEKQSRIDKDNGSILCRICMCNTCLKKLSCAVSQFMFDQKSPNMVSVDETA